jgi:hypothetical protein
MCLNICDLIHALFMPKCMFMDASNVVNVFLVVLSYLEKPDVPILLEKLVVPIFQTEGFDFAGKIGCSGLPNQTA